MQELKTKIDINSLIVYTILSFSLFITFPCNNYSPKNEYKIRKVISIELVFF